MNNKLNILTSGILKENPTLVMMLGTCPTLAVTKSAANSVGMGLATMFVLICSNLVISLLKKVIPKQVRLPCYIVIIAGFVTFVSLMLQVFVPELYDHLGLFLSLITVNCIILARAEMFASKNGAIESVLDGVGMGIGFTLALLVIGSIREILGGGSWFGFALPLGNIEPLRIMTQPAGGFFTFGIVIALVTLITKKRRVISCENCPSKEVCAKEAE